MRGKSATSIARNSRSALAEPNAYTNAARETLKSDPSALPKYLQSVPWNSAKDVQEAYRILYQWASPGPVDALTLLDHTTPDPKVRALAVSLLEGLTGAFLAS